MENVLDKEAVIETEEPDQELTLEITEDPEANPLILSTLVDASRLVGFLSDFGGTVFTWRYPRDPDGELRRYRIDTNLRWPLSEERESAIHDFVEELGGQVTLLIHAKQPKLDLATSTEVLIHVTMLVMEFPVVAGR